MVRNVRFVPSAGSSAEPSPPTSTPGSASVSIENSLESPTASARQSNPEPRLATVAGARAVSRISLQSELARNRGRIRGKQRGTPGTGDRPVRLLEAMPGEDAHDRRSRLEAPVRGQLQEPRDGG